MLVQVSFKPHAKKTTWKVDTSKNHTERLGYKSRKADSRKTFAAFQTPPEALLAPVKQKGSSWGLCFSDSWGLRCSWKSVKKLEVSTLFQKKENHKNLKNTAPRKPKKILEFSKKCRPYDWAVQAWGHRACNFGSLVFWKTRGCLHSSRKTPKRKNEFSKKMQALWLGSPSLGTYGLQFWFFGFLENSRFFTIFQKNQKRKKTSFQKKIDHGWPESRTSQARSAQRCRMRSFFPTRSIREASARQHQARCSVQVALCKLLCVSCSA